MINDKNKIPGCETFTRPEEIKALSKYLGYIKKVQEEHTKLDDTALIVPGKDTGKFPEIDSLPQDVEKLDIEDKLNNKLPNNQTLPIPDLNKDIELSNIRLGLDDDDKSITEADIANYGNPEKLKDAKEDNSLSDYLEKLEDKRKTELDETRIDIEDQRDTKLDNTRLDLEDPRNIELENTRLDIRDDRDTKLENKVLDLKDSRNIKLDDTRVDIEDQRETNLDNTILKIEDNRKEELSQIKLNLEDDRNLQLDDTKLNIDDPRNTKLSDVRLDITDDKNTELEDTIIGINDERNIELDNTKLNIDDKRDISLNDTKLNIQDDREIELPNAVLNITDEQNPQLSNVRLDIRDERNIELPDKVLDIKDDRDTELSDVRLDIRDERNIELPDKVLDIKDDRDTELEDKVIGLQDEREINLSDTILKITDEREPELSDTILDLSDDRDTQLSDTILNIDDTRDIILTDTKLNIKDDRETKLEDKVIDLQDNRDIILPNTKLDIEDSRKTGLEDKIIDLRDDREPELSDVILGIRDEREINLEDTILNIYDERNINLPDAILKINDERDIELDNTILEIDDKRNVELSDKILELNDDKDIDSLEEDSVLLPDNKNPENEDIESRYESDNTILKSPNKNPNGEVEDLYENVMAMIWDNDQYNHLGNKKEMLGIDGSEITDNPGENIMNWQSKISSLVSAYLSSPDITPQRAEEFKEKLFSIAELGDYASKFGGETGKTLEIPEYQLPGKFSISSTLRYLAERGSRISGRSGDLRRELLEDTLWLLIIARDSAEELSHTSRSSLPGYVGGVLSSIVHERNVGEVIKGTAINTAKSTINSVLTGADHTNPQNYPEKETTGWELGNNRDSGGTIIGSFKNILGAMKNTVTSLKKQALGKFGTNNDEYSFSSNYLNTFGIQTTLSDLCYSKSSSVGSVEELYDVLKSSPYITTPTKFGTIEKGLYKSQTLDSNTYWEVILEPFVHPQMNGGFSYLPAIQEINAANITTHGVNTGYNRWIPINSFELNKSKVGTKTLGLYDGEISYPITIEFTNEVRLTIVDDQFKSWRRYFENCAAVSVYNSEAHKQSYYESVTFKTYNDRTDITPTAIDKSNICIALYKNITFRCRIYIMTPQFSTIKRYDLLLVMKDFSEEYSGDVDASASDLTVNFSIVGENPPESSALTILGQDTDDKIATREKNKEIKLKRYTNNKASKVSKALSLL